MLDVVEKILDRWRWRLFGLLGLYGVTSQAALEARPMTPVGLVYVGLAHVVLVAAFVYAYRMDRLDRAYDRDEVLTPKLMGEPPLPEARVVVRRPRCGCGCAD